MRKDFISLQFAGGRGFRMLRECLSFYLREVMQGKPDAEIIWTEVAVNEALNNAYKNALLATVNNEQRRPLVKVSMYLWEAKELRIRISDSGLGFNGQARIKEIEKDIKRGNYPLDDFWVESGRGLFLLRAGVDRVKFNKKGNSVTLCKSVE